ncbi:hypothetical protein TM7_0030 [candidate division TM7 genomosp. GTL1]|nr:hypothetical protein TM7_0030 [candidate division TM7 genomosp. GTL1]
MSRPKGSKNARKQDPIFSLSVEERINLLANLIVDVIWKEQVQQKASSATIKPMSFPIIPLPSNDNSKAAQFFHKMDTEAKGQGMSGWFELMAKQSPEMADIFARIVEGELAVIRKEREAKPTAS